MPAPLPKTKARSRTSVSGTKRHCSRATTRSSSSVFTTTSSSVTTDRYVVDGQLRQVMLASRELSPEKLPAEAQRWVNRYLQFTHGYGAAMTPVTEVAPGGRPAFFLKDVPPKGQVPLSRPEIYYGLKSLPLSSLPVPWRSSTIPGPDGPVYTQYKGTGGVGLSSFLRRFLYAWQFRDLNLLISGEIHKDSRIQYRRTIAGTLLDDYSVPRARRRPLPGRCRRPAVLDPGRLYRRPTTIPIRCPGRAARTTSATA